MYDDVVCLYIGVLICMHMSAYVCGVSICICLYVCGGANVAWMMVQGLQGVRDGACGCGVGCDWSCAVCSGWTAACMYGVVVVVVLGGHHL